VVRSTDALTATRQPNSCSGPVNSRRWTVCLCGWRSNLKQAWHKAHWLT